MSSEHAQLSAASTTLDDLTERITAVAERYDGTPREDVAAALYEVERALRSAARRLRSVVVDLA
jgi:hypothetical protein